MSISKVMLAYKAHQESGYVGFGPLDFLAGACYMAELFADGQGALRETLEALRNDLRMLNADKLRRAAGDDS